VPAEARPARQSPAKDIILFWGAGLPRRDRLRIQEKCRKLGVDLRVINIASAADFSPGLKNQLYLGGELGRNTQVLACFHGGSSEPSGRHEIEVGVEKDGANCVDTIDFLSWLRTAPEGMPCGPEPADFHGTVHIHSCRAKLLSRHLKPGSPEWNKGNCFAYSSGKDTSYHQGITTMLDLCELLGQAIDDATLLDPVILAARAIGVTGDTVSFFGPSFHETLLVRAARTREEAHPEFVIHNLELGEQCTTRISGSEEDRAALLAALRSRKAEGNIRNRHMVKLHNVFSTRACRLKLDHMDALLRAYPCLAGMRDVDDISVEELHYNVNVTLESRQAIAGFREGRGTPETLIKALDTLAILAPDDWSWREDVAQAVERRPHMQAPAMRWALLNNELDFFCHMLSTLERIDRVQIAREFLPFALRGCASMALPFLHTLVGPASTAAYIAEGVRLGASRSVLAEWLSREDWFIHEAGIAAIVKAAVDAGMLNFLLDHVVQDIAEAIDPVFQILKQNGKSCTSAIARLFQLAQAQGNRSLSMKIRRQFPGVVESPGSSFKSRSYAAGHSQRRTST
jgi:hypothetical protein